MRQLYTRARRAGSQERRRNRRVSPTHGDALPLGARVRYAQGSMRKISRRDALFVLGAPACAAAPQIAGRAAAGGELPPGVKAVWDLAKAYRESTATRERLSINGLWRWQPAGREAVSYTHLRAHETDSYLVC